LSNEEETIPFKRFEQAENPIFCSTQEERENKEAPMPVGVAFFYD
jgi:hypothetical protein